MPEIEKRLWQKYDGESKYKTLDCDECGFKVNFSGKEICCWGVAFKYLCKIEKMRRCEYYNQFLFGESQKETLDYVISAIKNKCFEKKDKYVQPELKEGDKNGR